MTAPESTPVLKPDQITRVPIELLTPDADQARRVFNEDSLKALAAELRAKGDPEQPLVVRSDWVIKDGERRWRAAKLAGLKDLPCMLAKPAAEENATVEWRLDQACVNHHRDPLTALDWAHLLRELVERHGQKVGELPALLKKRGIEMSRSYISNLIRLNELPDWARALIARGVLPAAAGKYILMAAPYAPALEALRVDIETEAARLAPGYGLRGDLSWNVRSAFRKTATSLDQNYGEDAPRFPWQSACKGCPNHAQVDNMHFCLGRACYDQKQAAAKPTASGRAEATTQTKRKPDPRAAARQRQERAKVAARNLAIKKIAWKAEAAGNLQDYRLIAQAMIREMHHDSLKVLFASRGWEPGKRTYGNGYHDAADREIAKLNAAALRGLLMECALRGALSDAVSGKDHLAETAKRHRIDLKALERQTLAGLKSATTVAKEKA